MVIATFVWLMTATLLGMMNNHTLELMQRQGEAVNARFSCTEAGMLFYYYSSAASNTKHVGLWLSFVERPKPQHFNRTLFF
jgi:hypothetical protein